MKDAKEGRVDVAEHEAREKEIAVLINRPLKQRQEATQQLHETETESAVKQKPRPKKPSTIKMPLPGTGHVSRGRLPKNSQLRSTR